MVSSEEWEVSRPSDEALVAVELEGEPAIVVRLYRASHREAFETFGREAPIFEDRGYGVDSVTWAPGEWDSATAILATLLILVGIGILMIAYMLVAKPPGTLVVIFGRASTT